MEKNDGGNDDCDAQWQEIVNDNPGAVVQETRD